DALQGDAGNRAVIWSLGEIGDNRAVPEIILQCRAHGTSADHLEALGKLATTKAVDFIIKRLFDYGAVEALYRTQSKRALPALQEHFEKLQRAGRAADSQILAATRIAIIRLSQKDGREALLQIFENATENRDARFEAQWALQECDTTPFQARILQLYKTDPDADIKRICIRLLEDKKLEGITEAMMEHALQVGDIRTKDDSISQYYLRKALNKQLGTLIDSMEEMQSYIGKLRRN